MMTHFYITSFKAVPKNIELPTDNILHHKCSTQIMFKIDNYTIQFDLLKL